MDKKIKQILVDGIGYCYNIGKYDPGYSYFANIIPCEVNGDMAKIIYYLGLDEDGNVMTEFNGRFVVLVDYEFETNKEQELNSTMELLYASEKEMRNVKGTNINFKQDKK